MKQHKDLCNSRDVDAKSNGFSSTNGIKNASKLIDLIIEINQQLASERERETSGLLLQVLSHCQTLSINYWCI